MTKTNKERVPRIKELVSSNKLPSRTLQGLSGNSQGLSGDSQSTTSMTDNARAPTMTDNARNRIKTRSMIAEKGSTEALTKKSEEGQYYASIAFDTEETSEELQAPSKIQTVDCNMQNEKLYQTTTEFSSFAFLQNTVIPLIKLWECTNEASVSDFYNQWQLWKGKINEDSTFEDVLSHTKIFDLWEYMNQLNTCPAIKDTLLLTWDIDTNSILWKKTLRREDKEIPSKVKREQLQHTTDIHSQLSIISQQVNLVSEQVQAKLDNLSEQVQTTMEEYYESIEKVQENLKSLEDRCHTAVHTADKKIQEMNNKTSFFHNKLEDRLDSAAARIATTVAHHQKQFQDYIESHKNAFKAQVQQEISDAVQIALDDQITPTLEAHINELNSNKEHAVQKIKNMMIDFKKQDDSHVTSQTSILDKWPEHHDNAPHATPWKADTAITKCTMAEIPPHDSKATTITRDRYGRSTVRTFTVGNNNHNYKQWDTRHPNFQANTDRDSTQSRKSQPTFHSNEPSSTYPYTPLNHHDFIKKGQIVFTGDIYSFYHKLHNIGRQYGVYTKKLADVKYGMSICPDSHNGHYFSDMEYQEMAAALYEKLSDPSIIPITYTKYRNITDRYAEENDGYAALYEILEDSHPTMQRDPVFKAPHLHECSNNLQIYASRFKSYMTSEQLSNRQYTEKEQVQMFLRGLDDEYQPAVQYVNMLMAAWTGKDELNPLCRINALPKTLEDFIGAYSDTSIIRTVKDCSSHVTDPDGIIRYAKDQKNRSDLESRKTSDITCDACGMHGHGWRNCDHCAKQLKCDEFIKNLDANKRQDLLDRFAKEQLRRRTLKLRNRPARVRFLQGNDIDCIYELIADLEADTHQAALSDIVNDEE
jgi:hypothetical protein